MDMGIKGGLEFTLDAVWTRKGPGVVGAWIAEGGGRVCVGYGAVHKPDTLFDAALRTVEDLHKEAIEVGPLSVCIPVGPNSGLNALMRRDRLRGYINWRTGLPYSSFVHQLRSLEHQRRLSVLRETNLKPVLAAHLKAYVNAAALILPAYPRIATQEEWAQVFSEIQDSTDFASLGGLMEARNGSPEALTAH